MRRRSASLPGYAQAHNNLAVLLHQRGQVAEACRQLQLAVQCDPSNRGVWLNWCGRSRHWPTGRCDRRRARPCADASRLRQRTGRTGIPARHPATAGRGHPTPGSRPPSGSGPVGGALLPRNSAGPTGRAAAGSHALLEAVVRQQPDSAVARFNLGTAYLAAGNRLPDAIAQFTAAVQFDPQFADAHFNLATALESAGGNRTEAIAHYRAAARFQPEVPATHFRLALLLADRSADAPGSPRRSGEDAGAGSRLSGCASPAQTAGSRGQLRPI